MTPTTPGFRSIRQIMARSQPQQPARFAAIVAHLTRDREQNRLTLKGPDLAYYCAFAQPGDTLRDWTMAALDARIAATAEARLGGATITERHVCQVCLGKGMDCHNEVCEPCGGIGLVCPMCRGGRWTTNGMPERYTDHAHATACPGCMTRTPTGWQYSHALAQRTIQDHIHRPYSPSLSVRDRDIEAAYTRAEATARERRERPPEPTRQRPHRRTAGPPLAPTSDD